MRKKIYILVFALICILSLAACGSDEEKDAAAVDIEAAIAEIDEAVSTAELTDEELSQVEALKAEMKKKVEAADTEEERQDIVDEYKAKIEEVTSGKVSREAVSEEESDDNDSNSQSSDSGDKSSSSSSGSSSTASSGNTSSNTSSGGSSDSSSTAGKEKVWVVDVPTVYEKEPIYEGGYDGYWAKLKDGTILKFGTGTTGAQDCLNYVENNAGIVSRYGSGIEAELVGYREVCVQEEQGHWEYR